MMYLKDITVPIPFDQGHVVVRRGTTVEYEIDRIYCSKSKNSRVQRRTIGRVDPFFPGKMYPNELYFSMIPNNVPAEIRDNFLNKCKRKREIAELKKDPEAMMRQLTQGMKMLKEKGREYALEAQQADNTQEDEDVSSSNGNSGNDWFISDEYDLEYLLKVFRDLYDMMEVYATKNPGGVVDGYKVKMFNKILEELKSTLPDHRIIQCLDLLEEPEWEEDEEGKKVLRGATNSDAVMLLAWYKNALAA